MIHNSNGDRQFIEARDISEDAETGDKLSEILDQSVQISKKSHVATVFALVSDNASNMIKMGKNVNHYLWHSTCNSHSGNLLAEDIIDQDLNVADILKEFKNTPLENALLRKGGTKIVTKCKY